MTIAELNKLNKAQLIELLNSEEVEFDDGANKETLLKVAIEALADDYEAKFTTAEIESLSEEDVQMLIEENEIEHGEDDDLTTLKELLIKAIATDYNDTSIDAGNFLDKDVNTLEPKKDNSDDEIKMEELRGQFLTPHQVQVLGNRMRNEQCARIREGKE